MNLSDQLEKTKKIVQEMSLEELYAIRKFALKDMQIVCEKKYGFHLSERVIEDTINVLEFERIVLEGKDV